MPASARLGLSQIQSQRNLRKPSRRKIAAIGFFSRPMLPTASRVKPATCTARLRRKKSETGQTY